MPSTPAELLRAMRPNQWVKNVFVLAPLVFAQRMTDSAALATELAAFAVFCALSSSVYLVNDIFDREADRLHPGKRNRPIASGRLSTGTAGAAAVLLALAGLGGGIVLGVPFATVAAGYLVMNFLYSAALKRVVILDVCETADNAGRHREQLERRDRHAVTRSTSIVDAVSPGLWHEALPRSHVGMRERAVAGWCLNHVERGPGRPLDGWLAVLLLRRLRLRHQQINAMGSDVFVGLDGNSQAFNKFGLVRCQLVDARNALFYLLRADVDGFHGVLLCVGVDLRKT